MIQRIQTVFLALIGVSMIIFLGVTIWHKHTTDLSEELVLSAFRLVHYKKGTIAHEKPVFWLASLAIGILGLSVYSLLQYKKRLLQLQLGFGLALLLLILLGLIVYHSVEGEKLMPASPKGSFGIGFIIPAIALLCNMAANRFIKKDEDVVRESNRMR